MNFIEKDDDIKEIPFYTKLLKRVALACEKLNVNIEKKFVTKSPHLNRKTDYMMQMFKWNKWDHWDEWTDDNNDTFVEMSPLYLDAEDENIEIVKILLQEKNLDINSLSKFSFENPEENYKLM